MMLKNLLNKTLPNPIKMCFSKTFFERKNQKLFKQKKIIQLISPILQIQMDKKKKLKHFKITNK